MKARRLLHILEARNVKLWAEGDRLKWDAPIGLITDEIKARMTAQKMELLALIKCKEADGYHEDHGEKVSEVEKHLVAQSKDTRTPPVILDNCFVASKHLPDKSVREIKIELTPNTIYQGHALEVLKAFPAETIDCVVTSPPYWGLRNYDTDPVIWNEDKNCEHDWSEESLTGQKTPQTKYLAAKEAFTPTRSSFCSKCGCWRGELGAEPTPELFVSHLCDIFDEVKRVLKPTGTCWINIADSYANNGNYIGKYLEKHPDHKDLHSKNSERYPQSRKGYRGPGVKAKSLVGIPERFVVEMQKRGWIRRNSIVWWKRSCMPSSAKDRFTVDFEYLYFFVKEPKYYFEQQVEDAKTPGSVHVAKDGDKSSTIKNTVNATYFDRDYRTGEKRNKRCVWDILPGRCPDAHFAVFPEELAKTPIVAGCPEGGIVLDCFAGTGTTCKVAYEKGRRYVGIELNADYVEMAEKRLDRPNIIRISAKDRRAKNRFEKIHILSEQLEEAKQRIESVEPIKRQERSEIFEIPTAGHADDNRVVNKANVTRGKIVVLKPPADEKLRMAA